MVNANILSVDAKTLKYKVNFLKEDAKTLKAVNNKLKEDANFLKYLSSFLKSIIETLFPLMYFWVKIVYFILNLVNISREHDLLQQFGCNYFLIRFLNDNPLICLYCGLVAPKTDLTYFFTSNAISTKPVVGWYIVVSLAIIALLYCIYALIAAVFIILYTKF